jgi:hypothetical protein
VTSRTVRLTQIDGKLPNLALMKLSHWHRQQGDSVFFSRSVYRDMIEPKYDVVYGSAIFDFSHERLARFKAEFPGAILGGTGVPNSFGTVEDIIGEAPDHYDYTIYPNFTGSIGFTARGCRLKCGFCVVPKKEGKPRAVNTISEIYRGLPHPKHLHLLDNDFFGQPREQWQARLDEIRNGGFKVCFNQGINIRMIDDESSAALASVQYYDDGFSTRRIYTAWDNIGDEERFFRGIDTLEKHGVPPHHVMAYMLIGYDKREDWGRVMMRFNKMVARKIRPYPMVYGNKHRTLPMGGCNQRIAHRMQTEQPDGFFRLDLAVAFLVDHPLRLLRSRFHGQTFLCSIGLCRLI